MGNGIGGKILDVWFAEGDTAAREMTLRVEHPDKTLTYIVVAIDRMSHRITPARKPRKRRRRG